MLRVGGPGGPEQQGVNFETGPTSLPELANGDAGGMDPVSDLPSQTDIKELLEVYAGLLKDKTFVPSIEDFEQMQKFAREHVQVILPRTGGPERQVGLAGRKPMPDQSKSYRVAMRYVTDNTSDGLRDKKLNPYQARALMDGLRDNEWELTPEEREVALEVSRLTDVDLIGEKGKKQLARIEEPSEDRRGRELMTLAQFEALFEEPPTNVHSKYRDYIDARLRLDAKFDWQARMNEAGSSAQ